MEKKRVYESETSANQITRRALRIRGSEQILGSGVSSDDKQRPPGEKTFSRDLILRLIDLIKDV
jgi:hypothetical protein